MSSFGFNGPFARAWRLVIAVAFMALSAVAAAGLQDPEPPTAGTSEPAITEEEIAEGDASLYPSRPPEPAAACRSTGEPKVVLQGSDDPVVMLDVGADGEARQGLSRQGLGLSEEQAVVRVFNPNARSPHFYALLDDGRRWALRAYCKDPVLTVSEEVLHEDETPDPDHTVELGDWAFAMRVGEQRVLVWLKGDDGGRWIRLSTGEPIAAFTLGSVPEGIRLTVLGVSGELGLRLLEVPGPLRVPLGMGKIEAREQVDLIDRGSSLYVLTSGAGRVYRPQGLLSLYEENGDWELVGRDSFFSPNGRNFGVLLLGRVEAESGPGYRGVVIALPEDGQPQRSQAIDLTGEIDAAALVDEPRIFVRAEDNAFTQLHACLAFKRGQAGESEGFLKPLRLSRPYAAGSWRIGARGEEQSCGTVDLDEIHVVGTDGRKDRILHHLESRTGNHTCTCSF